MKKAMILVAAVMVGILILMLAYELFSAGEPATVGSRLSVKSVSANTLTILNPVSISSPPSPIMESRASYLTNASVPCLFDTKMV